MPATGARVPSQQQGRRRGLERSLLVDLRQSSFRFRSQCKRDMKSRPHIFLRRFERRILRPLDFAFYAAALYYLWHHAWFLGIAVLILSLGVGAIGRGLPHRRHETPSEITTGTTFASEFQGEISDDDSCALGRAFFKTCTLASVTAVIVLWHENLRWYWILLAIIAVWPILHVIFLSLTIGLLKVVQNVRRTHRLY